MPAYERVGRNRTSAVARIVGAIAYFGFVGWVLAAAAVILAALYAVGDLALTLTLNQRLDWGKSWPKAIFDWNIDLLYWLFFGRDFPGALGWMP